MESACSDNNWAEKKIRSLDCLRLESRVNRLITTLQNCDFDVRTPCCRTNCQVAWHLPLLNKTLFEAAMQLTEHCPGAFTLSSIQTVNVDIVLSDSSLLEGAILLYWLLKHHLCITRLVLGTNAIPILYFPALLSDALLANKGLVEVQAHPVYMGESWREIQQCSVVAAALGQLSLRLECMDMIPLIIDHHSAQVIANGIQRGRLRRLGLWSEMSCTAARRIFSAMNTSMNLSSLEISGFKAFSKSCALILATVLRHNNTLQKLSVKFMVEDVLGIILTSLEKNSTLKELSLDSAADVSHFTLWDGLQALRANTKLSCLKLTNVDFNNSCAIVIADILGENNSLQELSISMNYIGNAGGRALAWALSRNSCLKGLDISGNRLPGSVVQPFIDALAVNRTLECVYLGGIDVPEEWVPAWPPTGDVPTRLRVTWNTHGIKAYAKCLRCDDCLSFSQLYVGWTNNACSSGIAQWFSPVCAVSSALTELTIECSRTLGSASSAAVASFLEATSSLKKLVVRPTSIPNAFVTHIISSLACNTSVCEAVFDQNLHTDQDVKALQTVFRANRILHRLKFTGYWLNDKAPSLLARALEHNFVFLTFEFECFIARNNMNPLLNVLNRNRSLLNRAVECVLGATVDERSLGSLGHLSTCDSLLDAVSSASGKTLEESRHMVFQALHCQKSSSNIALS